MLPHAHLRGKVAECLPLHTLPPIPGTRAEQVEPGEFGSGEYNLQHLPNNMWFMGQGRRMLDFCSPMNTEKPAIQKAIATCFKKIVVVTIVKAPEDTT